MPRSVLRAPVRRSRWQRWFRDIWLEVLIGLLPFGQAFAFALYNDEIVKWWTDDPAQQKSVQRFAIWLAVGVLTTQVLLSIVQVVRQKTMAQIKAERDAFMAYAD